jgi:hypothetical protein
VETAHHLARGAPTGRRERRTIAPLHRRQTSSGRLDRAGHEAWRALAIGRGPSEGTTIDGPGEDAAYHRHRLRAFALACEGGVRSALAELDRGASWAVPPSLVAVDVARIHLLAGDPGRALAALRGLARIDAPCPVGTASVLAASVKARPSLWREALTVARVASSSRLRHLH